MSHIGKTVNGQILGLDAPAWDISCFYFHDAAVQTNGVDDPVKQRADQRIQLAQQRAILPVDAARRAHAPAAPDGPRPLQEFPTRRQGMTVQLRLEAINALNYTVLWNPDTNPRNSTFGFINQDRNNPRDIQIGLRVTF